MQKNYSFILLNVIACKSISYLTKIKDANPYYLHFSEKTGFLVIKIIYTNIIFNYIIQFSPLFCLFYMQIKIITNRKIVDGVYFLQRGVQRLIRYYYLLRSN